MLQINTYSKSYVYEYKYAAVDMFFFVSVTQW